MFSFNAEQEEDFSLTISNGVYPVMITEAEYKPANSNPNNYVLSLTFAICDDSSQVNGFKIYDNFNVDNVNEVAQKIGRSDLKKLCMAVGLPSFNDPQQLVGYGLLVETKNREYQGKTYANVVDRSPLAATASHAPVQQYQQAPLQPSPVVPAQVPVQVQQGQPVQAQQYPVPHQEQPQRQQPAQAQQQQQQPPNLDNMPF